MSFWKDYLRIKSKNLILYFSFILVFAIVFLLYRIPVMAVLYPLLLCAMIGCVYAYFDYNKMRSRWENLDRIRIALPEGMNLMPEANDVIEEEYQDIAEALNKIVTDSNTVSAEKYHQMLDYYTMWVHQIKTPIASMRLTLENEDSEASRRLSSDLLRIEQYVSMVLNYLRLDFDESDYVFREVSVDDMVKPLLRRFAGEFIGRRIGLSYSPIEDTLVTDEKWFSFVLEQVISNALKYTREGEIKIYIQDNSLVIEDSGMGIAAEDLPRIFDKGYTGYNGRKDKKASGIGLYLCKRICDNLRLDLNIESKIDVGTKVIIGIKQKTIDCSD